MNKNLEDRIKMLLEQGEENGWLEGEAEKETIKLLVADRERLIKQREKLLRWVTFTLENISSPLGELTLKDSGIKMALEVVYKKLND